MKQFLVGAATSNSGKTTFSLGVMRALTRRGLSVQPYKCGPDYIDTMLHKMACGRTSINLDTYMSSESHVRDLYRRYGSESDMRIVEGVMGLFDGYSKSNGSSAQMAMLLDLPVILVVNSQSVAYSVAPLIFGFRNFDARLQVAGVVFNNVASANHYAMLRDACADAGVDCLGYMSRNSALVIPDRHLGLDYSSSEGIEKMISAAADEVEAHVELDKLLEI